MKNLFYLLFILSMVTIFSCQKNEVATKDDIIIKDGVPADIKQNIRTQASTDELNQLNNLFISNEVIVHDEMLHFKNSESFTKFVNLINLLNIEQLKDFERSKNYRSFYVDRYENMEKSNIEDVRKEKPYFYSKTQDDVNSILIFEKACNVNGVYNYIESIVFNSKVVNISQFKNRSSEEFNLAVKLYLEQNIKLDNVTYYENNNLIIESRVCGWESRTDTRDYTLGSQNKWFRGTAATFVAANPVFDNNSQFLRWDWTQGWRHNITNFRRYLLYSTTSNGQLFIKTDAFVQGNSNFQWQWQTCSNCHELDFSRITASGSVVQQSLIPGAPRFDPLIWFIAKVEEGVGNNNDCDDTNHPAVCFNCW